MSALVTGLAPISDIIWQDKYQLKTPEGEPIDKTPEDTFERVANAVFANDESNSIRAAVRQMLFKHDFVPGGRVIAGAGSPYAVTMINCFVNRTLEDSLSGILMGYNDTMLTMQKGGGIGTDFSTLRPNGARVKGVGADTRGPLSFMETWDAGCKTIASAGNRRGAMMATMRCDHPDVCDFIVAKQTPGRFTQFNLSVMITDSFMSAVAANEAWDLGFAIPRADGQHVEVLERDGQPWYVYKRLPARELWQMIIRNTYDYAEPGLLFIDRINQRNNLNYCELISATNPCGEQPLPPFGDCNLGAINFANFVDHPFTENAKFNFERFGEAVSNAVRFLDNVLDITKYPLPEQEEEAKSKRRIGLGPMGLGTMLMMMRIPYGVKSVSFVESVMDAFAEAAYKASALLAKDRGPFPLFKKKEFLAGYNVQKRSKETRDLIAKYGIRNGVLLTVAPTGTTATFADNVSGGLEPAFSLRYTRNVRKPGSEETVPHHVADRGFQLYCEANGFDPVTHPIDAGLPDYMVTALELTVEDHLAVQAACQKFIDASISKTINCPEDMAYEDFEQVYMKAWEMGCKGCTTYRPSGVRGAVLVSETDMKKAESKKVAVKPKAANDFRRPKVLHGPTYKVKWINGNFYITVNNTVLETVDGDTFEWPIEVFIRSQSPTDNEFMDALAITLTALLRQTAVLKQNGLISKGADMSFLFEHLRSVQSVDQGSFYEGRFTASRAALIARILEQHFMEMLGSEGDTATAELVSSAQLEDTVTTEAAPVSSRGGEACSQCGSHMLVRQEGCLKCLECGHGKCG